MAWTMQSPARAISFPLVRATILEQSVYHEIALHIDSYYIIINVQTIPYF